ncbi:MAG: ABC transporter substrate-binding protein [Rhodopirellula sp. JB055]|uniref:ABC transporter substrate-binding protein n=1 Tax=Rhodopirellula sp. JB055 TaxID=3342846 RepID=UPI00370A7824
MPAKTRLAKNESADRDAFRSASADDAQQHPVAPFPSSGHSNQAGNNQPAVWQRRQWLAWSSIAGAAVLTGCRESPSTDEAESAPTVRTDVPLRIVWTGTDSDAETLRRTWQSISDQPLKITVVRPPSATKFAEPPAEDATSIWAASSKADVVIFPLSQLGEMVSRDQIISSLLPESGSKTAPPAIRVAMTFSQETRGQCLGGSLPSLLVGEKATGKVPKSGSITWDGFEKLASEFPGQVAEPTAEGWAGVSYLWRLASVLSATWLFDRDTLEPLLTRPEYIDVLRQMVATNKHAPDLSLTPGEIFRQVSSGQLVAGIGFPQVGNNLADSDDDSTLVGNVQVSGLPIAEAGVANADGVILERTGRAVFAPQTLVGSLAASCRQTAAANQFLKWLDGGEGSEPLYRSIPGLQHPTTSSSIDEAAGGNYHPWLRSAWQNPNVMPPLNLVGGDRYLAVLDSQIRQCLAGKQTAEEACAAIAKSWSGLHAEYGVKKQKRSWQQAIGLL